MSQIGDGSRYAPTASADRVVEPGEFRFAAAYLDHGHIYGQTNGLRDAGATIDRVYDPDPDRVAGFCAQYPEARPAEKCSRTTASALSSSVNAPDCFSDSIIRLTASASRPVASKSSRSKFDDT